MEPHRRGWECEPRESSRGPSSGGVRLVQSVEGMGAAHFWSFPRRGLLEQINRPVVFLQGLPAFLYDLCFIVEEEISRAPPLSPTKQKGNPAESDTLNLICASHLFASVDIR